MNILVTGGRGQLGCSFHKIAAEYPHHNLIFTDIPELDITDPESVSQAVADNGIDVIVNCAAYTAVDRAESEPETARQINAIGPRVLAQTALRHGVKLVHISTDYVFDGRASSPLREDSPTGPTNVYGRTKLDGEREIESAGIDAAIIRTSWLYSEFGGNFVKTMLRLAESRDVVNVVDDQRGSPTYAPDLARTTMRLIDNGIEGCEIYHYSNAGNVSWCEFAAGIFAVAGRRVRANPITTAEYPTPASRPAYSVMDTSKIARAGAAVPEWRDSLKICIAAIEAGNRP